MTLSETIKRLDELEAKAYPAPWTGIPKYEIAETEFILSLRNAWPEISTEIKRLNSEISMFKYQNRAYSDTIGMRQEEIKRLRDALAAYEKVRGK